MADVDPRGDQIGDGRDIRFCGDKNMRSSSRLLPRVATVSLDQVELYQVVRAAALGRREFATRHGSEAEFLIKG